MIKLETNFESGAGGNSLNPRIFTQIKRNEKNAMYSRVVSSTGLLEAYEVFRIKIHKAGMQIFKQIISEDTESYPSTNDFGRLHAYFCLTRERAEIRWNELNNII